MEIRFIYDPSYEAHAPPRSRGFHPENPSRLWIAIDSIKQMNLWKREFIVKPFEASIDDILKIHDKDYVEYVKKAVEYGEEYLDLDTYVNEHTWRVALLAFGGAIKGYHLTKELGKALVLALVRPPGHHAGRSGRALGAPTLGFCVFNNIAGAAMKALEEGLDPIVVIDVDAHHGNGTQDIFWYEPRVIHIDFHEYGIYPGTGWLMDLGGGDAEGTKINIPFEAFSGDDDYIYAWLELVEPILEIVKPKFIGVSLGFDGFKGDGLTNLNLTEKFFLFFGNRLRILLKKLNTVGVLAVLEGGYSIGLRKGLQSFIKGFLSDEVDIDLKELRYSSDTRDIITRLRHTLRHYYRF